MEAEDVIGHSIIKGSYLNELVPKFEEMKNRGIVPSDKMKSQSFWAMVRKELKEQEGENLPCECAM